jgi:hypothetical protein
MIHIMARVEKVRINGCLYYITGHAARDTLPGPHSIWKPRSTPDYRMTHFWEASYISVIETA